MVRSDAENTLWWNKLTPLERDQLFEDLLEQTHGGPSEAFICSIRDQAKTRNLSTKQISALRRFADNMKE